MKVLILIRQSILTHTGPAKYLKNYIYLSYNQTLDHFYWTCVDGSFNNAHSNGKIAAETTNCSFDEWTNGRSNKTPSINEQQWSEYVSFLI